MKIYETFDQQTPDWDYIRKGKITGTGAKKLNGTPKAKDEYFYEILGERLTDGVAEGYENPMDRGNRLEPEARAMFEITYGVNVDQVAFCESDDNEFIGFSTDGFIADQNRDYTKAVEIKCPESKNYCKIWLKNAVPEEYEDQVAQAFIVNEKLELLYFVAYNPEITIHPMHVIEVTRESILGNIESLKAKELSFVEEVNDAIEKLIADLDEEVNF